MGSILYAKANFMHISSHASLDENLQKCLLSARFGWEVPIREQKSANL